MCCQGLSLKPHGGFHSFSAGRVIWPRRLDIPKIVTIVLILREQGIFIEYHDNGLVSMETKALSSFSHPPLTFLPSLVLVGP